MHLSKLMILGSVVVATSMVGSAPVHGGIFDFDFLDWQRGHNRPGLVEFVLDANERTGDFDTLVAALSTVSADPTQPDLLDTLSNDGPFTVFAPTDDAFEELGLTPDNVASALPSNVLTDVLLYHVAAGRKGAIRLLFERDIDMLNGDEAEFRFRFWPFGFFINGAKVIDPNNRTKNGIVHVIDGVLLPPEDEAAGASSVPEPNSAMLAASAMMLAAARGRRRRAA